jgi:hypothetical protein
MRILPSTSKKIKKNLVKATEELAGSVIQWYGRIRGSRIKTSRNWYTVFFLYLILVPSIYRRTYAQRGFIVRYVINFVNKKCNTVPYIKKAQPYGRQSEPMEGVLDEPYSQLTPLSGVAVQARQST